MTSRSESSQAGFSLLETLLALALTGVFLTLVFNSFYRATTAPAAAFARYERSEFALSMLYEYEMTWPDVPVEGEFHDQRWQITEEPCADCENSPYFDLIKVSLKFANSETRHAMTIARAKP